MKYSFSLLLAASALFVGCSDSAEKSKTPATTSQTTPAPQTTPEPAQPIQAPLTTTPPIVPVFPDSGATPIVPVAPSGNVKLNPPHGEPGHRCEIPVGQPLP